MGLDIKVGQRWRTRAGPVVRVTRDRAELDDEQVRWRWALSNSQIVDGEGRCDLGGFPHSSDLIQQVDEE
jgi:hypothetical protein